MVKNPANIDYECGATLVVVPAALLQQVTSIISHAVPCVHLFQWKDEVESKTNGMFTVHIHHGKDKIKVVCLLE